MRTFLLFIVSLELAVLLTGCRAARSVKPAAGHEFNLQSYQRVLVSEFADDLPSKTKAKVQARNMDELLPVTESFPNWIAVELGRKELFREVTRLGIADEQTLVISGNIKSYETESSTGVASSFFEAKVLFKDGVTADLLTYKVISRWGLNGALGGPQTVNKLMREVANDIAEDIASLKLTGRLLDTTDVFRSH